MSTIPTYESIHREAQRKGVSYTRILAEKRGLIQKGKASKTMAGKLDFTTKKGMTRDEKQKRLKGRKAYTRVK